MIEAKPKKKAAAPAVFVGQSTTERDREPDLVTAIFDVLIESHPDLMALREEGENAVRHRLKGLRGTVTGKPDSDTLARRVLSLFNGRNPREVARRLGITKQQVYKVLKQAGSK